MKKILSLISSVFLLSLFTISVFANSLNTIKIISVDVNNKPLLGFTYHLVEKDSNTFVKEVKFDANDTIIIEVPDGVYKLVEIGRPEGYDQADDVLLTLPYKISEDQYSKDLVLNVKHKLKVEQPKPTPEPKKESHKKNTGNTVDDNIYYILGASALAVAAILIIYKRKKDKK